MQKYDIIIMIGWCAMSSNLKNVTQNIKKAIIAHKIITVTTIAFFALTIFITPIVINAIQSQNQAKLVEKNPIKNLEEEKLKYIILDEITVETGSEIPNVIAYFDAEAAPEEAKEIKYYLNDKELTLDEISYLKDNKRYLKGTNKYKVIIDNNEKYTSVLNVVDKTKPIISLKDLSITSGSKYEAKNFVSQYSDNSRESTYTAFFKDDNQKSITKAGDHPVTIMVCDKSNNCTEDVANLHIKSKTTTKPFVKKVVNTITQEIKTNTENIKYGVKKVWYVKVKYDVYNDGTKKEVSRGNKYYKIDQSSFNGTTSSIRTEAAQVRLNIATTRDTIIKKTNEYRKAAGVNELVEDKNLTVMANIRAIEIAYSGKFDHKRPNGSKFSTVWDEYEGRNSNYVGENLAVDFKTDIGVCEGWKASRSHYDNMVHKRFTKIGVGKYSFNGRTYWVQLFEE